MAFVALLFFSDRNSVIDQYKLRKQYLKVKAKELLVTKKVISQAMLIQTKNKPKIKRDKKMI